MKLRRILLIIAAVASMAVQCAMAQTQAREQWMDQINQYKRTYFTKELDLNAQQQTKFFQLYDEMTEQTDRIDREARAMEQRLTDASDVTDLEYEKATEAMFDAKVQQAEVEKAYMVRFKDILTRKQLFKLKGVERKFSREMMRQHNRLRRSRVDGK